MERAIVRFGFDGDLARIGELDGIANEIDQHLRQAAAISMTRRQFGSKLELERELFVGRQRLQRTAHGLGDVLNAVIGKFENQLAGLDLGQIKHVIDESKQVLAVGLYSFEYAQHLLGRLTVSAVRHQFSVAQDGIERRAQLVAHIGEELRLVLARFFKLPALVLDFVKQSNILDRYHCLVGESRYKLYLLRIEWFYDFSAEKNDANRFSFTQERYAKMRAKAAQFRDIVFGIRKDIRDLDWLSLLQNSARHTSAPR